MGALIGGGVGRRSASVLRPRGDAARLRKLEHWLHRSQAAPLPCGIESRDHHDPAASLCGRMVRELAYLQRCSYPHAHQLSATHSVLAARYATAPAQEEAIARITALAYQASGQNQCHFRCTKTPLAAVFAKPCVTLTSDAHLDGVRRPKCLADAVAPKRNNPVTLLRWRPVRSTRRVC
jgi:hypothetical protein